LRYRHATTWRKKAFIDFLQGTHSLYRSGCCMEEMLRDQHFCNKIILPRKEEKDPNVLLQLPFSYNMVKNIVERTLGKFF
jgi:hypothetical protein